MEYIPTKYSDKAWLPKELIAQATKDNWLDTLIYFVRIKGLYHKPVFYNYSLRKLSKPLRCSPTTIKHHVDIMIAKNIAFIDGRHLRLKSTNSLKSEYGYLVPIGLTDNKSDQRNLLRFTLLKRNFHTQFRTYTAKSEALKFHNGEVKSRSEYISFRKKARLFPEPKKLECSIQDVLTLSNKKFGSICNRSQSTGIKIQKALNDMKLITSLSRVKLVCSDKTNRRSFFEQGFDTSYFLTDKGKVFKRLSNSISLSEYVVFQ